MDQLCKLAREILNLDKPAYSLRSELFELKQRLQSSSAWSHRTGDDISGGETRTAGGLAVSPTMASMCVNDLARTVVFVRGLHRAIQAIRRIPLGRSIRILYAGCGPYALLAIPLMATRAPAELSFTLVDIHRPSIESARCAIDQLGFNDHVIDFEVCDLCDYQIPADRLPDIILCETMNVCLGNEPQVAITRHLFNQAPAATLVPQSVRVDAYLIDKSREFAFAPSADAPMPPLQRDRVFLGTVFELSAQRIKTWHREWVESLPASEIHIPEPLESRYQPMLLTIVQVYEDQVLQSYESGITIPQRFPFAGQIRGGESFQFQYRLGQHPSLVCAIAKS